MVNHPPPRISTPERLQQGFHSASLDEMIADDHRVRVVWRYVEGLDLSALYRQIESVEGGAGRPAIDPRLLLGLWLYATVDGVGSGRALARLCEESLPYRWLCGGVSVNHHTLSDFRVGHKSFLDDLLTRSVGSLLHAGLVSLERVAHDGVRVRASAGAASFRRRSRLRECLKEARAQVEALQHELATDPGAGTTRQQAAQVRAATEREQRIRQALAAAEAMVNKDDEKARASTTDPQARVMKMADGGFRPAYNLQYATASDSRIIVGVDVTDCGSDQRQLVPMLQQLVDRYGSASREHLVDGGYVSLAGITAAAELGATVYAPVPKPKDDQRNPHEPRANDEPAVAEWRQRMGTEQAKAVYPERAALAECTNAQARNRGLTKLVVRGIEKVGCIALWYALAHNLMAETGWA
jgi:transposase